MRSSRAIWVTVRPDSRVRWTALDVQAWVTGCRAGLSRRISEFVIFLLLEVSVASGDRLKSL